MRDDEKFRRRAWTDSEIAAVRAALIAGSTLREASEFAGIARSTATAIASAYGIVAFNSVRAPTVVRMRDLARLGWAPSRIARRLRVNVEVVDHFLGSAS